MKSGNTPKYFDYLHKHGSFLTEHFDLFIERTSLEADIAHYRMRHSNERLYNAAASYLRNLLERIAYTIIGTNQVYEYSGVGNLLKDAIDDGQIPRSLGYKMLELNRRVRKGNHAQEYSQSELEAAFIQLDVVFRTILESEGKPISGNEVADGTDEVLLAHSESIEEKAVLAAQLTGNQRFVEEGREANRRAIAAERDAMDARRKEELASKENEQLRLDLESAKQTIEEQKAALSKKEAAYARALQDTERMRELLTKLSSRADVRAAELDSQQKKSNVKLAETRELRKAKEAAANVAADRVSDLEGRIDDVLNEYEFISTLLGRSGKATDEQRRVVNFPLGQTNKSRLLKVVGKAGTGKTLCLLAAVINYLEPRGQRMMSYGGQASGRRALFVCYNKDLASYINGLLEGFPDIAESIEVANYDQYLNQLVRAYPTDGFEHLKDYAQDVRFQRTPDQNGVPRYWDLVVDTKRKRDLVRQAMRMTKEYYRDNGLQQYCDHTYLDETDYSNVIWMTDEIEWLEGRYHDIKEGQDLYPSAVRVGRGGGRTPKRNSVERLHVTNVWVFFYRILQENRLYTLQQTVANLLRSRFLPSYDIVAIDEAQDLNMLHVELFARFMADGGYLLIAGDEGQRIYPRDFSWKQVDQRIRPITMTLSANKRNPAEIQHFAERLLVSNPGGGEVAPGARHVVQVRREPRARTMLHIQELASHTDETTAIVTSDEGTWERLLRDAGIITETSKDYSAGIETVRMSDGHVRPGVYCFTQLKTKGLEFDNVVIDYVVELDTQDTRRERRIRYMQFTRARKTLLIRYENDPPKLLQECYPDYLFEQE